MDGLSQTQIMDYDKYREICECFFKLAKDLPTQLKLKEILYNGKVGNYTFTSVVPHKDNPSIERQRRISLAYLLINNPDTFDYFVQNNIKIFHGTNANALPNILKYGINSLNTLKNKGIPVLTGEEWSREPKGRNFVSFTDVLDISRDYAESLSNNGEEELSFPVVFGTSDLEIEHLKKVRALSDIPEIAIDDFLPKESIKCICVPFDKIDFVKKMVNNPNIPVLGMDNYQEKFYYTEEPFIYISSSDFEKYREQKSKNSFKFKTSEIESLAKTRGILRMKEFIKKMKSKMVNDFKEEEYENGRNL